jgi:uncharacterized protein YciI
MLFALICIDKPDSTAVRMEARPRHLAHIQSHIAHVKIAGPFVSDDGATMKGSLLILDFPDMAAARAFADADPYAQAGLFSSVDIRPWKWTVGAPKE